MGYVGTQKPMQNVVAIQANIQWQYFQDSKSQNWIAICDPLKLTLVADTLPELHESMAEAMDGFFKELLSTGDLQEFLKEHGWSTVQALPPRTEEDVFFDVPMNTRRISQHDLENVFG
jgi:hypothetical protein